jgi:2-aminoethylphosphonate-pyruvate transaminase
MIFPPRKILLNPGPATTSDTVKQALVVADICPREIDFGAVISAVRRDLLAVAEADAAEHTAILLSGPGTAAIEAALGSTVPPHGRVLILDNGAYGARAGEIAAAIGLPAHLWHVPWTESPEPAELAAQLDGPAGPFTHAFWVHHETTTGLLNPMRAYGEVCRERGVISIVDGMSSFAGLPLSLRDEPVDLLVGSANKCLQSMPGVTFVLARRTALAASAGVRRSVALDLHRHERSLAAASQFPFTPPVQVVYALAQALRETLAETVPVRAARYRACYETMLTGMESFGFVSLLRRPLHSGLLTAFRTPSWPRFSFEALHHFLYARNITLYPGKLPGTETFRVANIGAIVPADLVAFLAEVGNFLDAS